MVLQSANSLMSIINEILDFSKIESGKLEILPTKFQLRESIGDTLKSLALQVHERELELIWRVAPSVPDHLLGDAARVRQIIVNLVGNAIKFTKQGQVFVDVQCAALTESTAELQFSVSDSGIGIAAEKLEAIFDPFEQADASTTREFGGTGLGLAICKDLVEIMGGKIWVESEEGAGATFYFTINFGLPSGVSHESNQQLSSIAAMPVLVADDTPTNRLVLEELLKDWGLDVDVVPNGQEAIDLLTRNHHAGNPFKLLISDLHMPQMDGLNLCEQVRKTPSLVDLKIILLTSRAGEGNERRCNQLRIAQSLVKPVKHSELLSSILEVVGVTASTYDRTGTTEGVRADRLPALRILVAEDGVTNQKMAVGLLTGLGHHVTIANNGREAIDLVASSSFDVVLMDVQMPVMDGLEATKHIRQQEEKTGLHLPIIALTAHAMPGDREKCLRAGMDDYVSKPVRRQELYVALEAFFPTDKTNTANPSAR